MVKFTYLSGSLVPFDLKLLVEILKSEKAFLGFARSKPSWGQCALIKFSIYKNKQFPNEIMEYYTQSNGFVDLKSEELGYSSGSRRIFIGRALKNSSPSSISDITIIDEDKLGQVYVNWMNDKWMLVEGLKPQYYFDVENYDYYIVNYGKDFDKALKIETIKSDRFPYYETKCYLGYALDENAQYPSEIISEAGTLIRMINSYGEELIYNLNALYEIPRELKAAKFFIVDETGKTLYPPMNYVEEILTPNEKILVFEFISPTNTAFRIKITSKKSELDGICVFHESPQFVYIQNPISDANPPALQLAYLRDEYIEKSIFDVRGIIKIKKEEVFYAKLLKSDEEKQKYQALGWDIQYFDYVSDEDNMTYNVTYAITDNKEKALSDGFDSIAIIKNVPNDIPTEDIYRQLFICYQPKDKDGNICSENYYQEQDLFDVSKYSYDIGTLLYIANKHPVYRKFIDGDEKFTIIL